MFHTKWDIASIQFGNVSNSVTSGDDATKGMVTIQFCALQLDVDGLTFAETEYLSAGAEYNAGDNVWVGMAPYTINDAAFVRMIISSLNITL